MPQQQQQQQQPGGTQLSMGSAFQHPIMSSLLQQQQQMAQAMPRLPALQGGQQHGGEPPLLGGIPALPLPAGAGPLHPSSGSWLHLPLGPELEEGPGGALKRASLSQIFNGDAAF